MYHYKECGLNNIYLVNGVEIDENEYTAIHNANDLNKAIVIYICNQKAWISSEQLKFLRIELNSSQASLAKLLCCSRQTIARWEKGSTRMPYIYDAVIRTVFLNFIGVEREIVLSVKKLEDAEGAKVQSKVYFKESNGNWEVTKN